MAESQADVQGSQRIAEERLRTIKGIDVTMPISGFGPAHCLNRRGNLQCCLVVASSHSLKGSALCASGGASAIRGNDIESMVVNPR